jgi:lipopolysaccharide biosynthesis glycosyltransferase
MSKDVIAIINDYPTQTKFRRTCINSIKQYAQQIGRPIIEYKTEEIQFEGATPHWKKISLIKSFVEDPQFEEYDNLLYIDTDIFFNKKSSIDGLPNENNIFYWFHKQNVDFMAVGDFCMHEEWIQDFRGEILKHYQLECPHFYSYFNSGVLVLNKKAAKAILGVAIQHPPIESLRGSNYEQGYFNFLVIKSVLEEGMRYRELGTMWNNIVLSEGNCSLGIFNHFAGPFEFKLEPFRKRWNV